MALLVAASLGAVVGPTLLTPLLADAFWAPLATGGWALLMRGLLFVGGVLGITGPWPGLRFLGVGALFLAVVRFVPLMASLVAPRQSSTAIIELAFNLLDLAFLVAAIAAGIIWFFAERRRVARSLGPELTAH